MAHKQLVEVCNLVETTGTEIQIAEFILAKISAEEFEKLLS